MGRGQQTLRDHFSPVIGDRRGSGREDVEQVPQRLGQEFAYAELEHAPDEDLEFFLRSDLQLEPAKCRFRLCELPLTEVGGAITTDLEAYLIDDNETAYHKALAMVDLYEDGGREALPPIVFWRDDGRVCHMLDGYKRLAAAHHVRFSTLRAYELIR